MESRFILPLKKFGSGLLGMNGVRFKNWGAIKKKQTHGNHSRSNIIENIVIQTLDTDVFIIMMFFLHSICNLYMKTETKGKVRIIDLEAVK